MNNIESLNSSRALRVSTPDYGMIDASAYHSSLATWPVPLTYVQIENAASRTEPVSFIDVKTATERLAFIDGVKCRHFMTVGMGNVFVKLNSRMYNTEKVHNPEDIEKLYRIMGDISELLNGRLRKDIKNKKELSRLDELEKEEKSLREAMTDIDRKDIPSLIVAQAVDMELAHIAGYDGELIYQENKETGQVFYKKHGQDVIYLDEDDALMFQNLERQILDMEAVVAKNPSRVIPMFPYNPHRYRRPNEDSPGDNGCEAWNKPFARIIGHKDTDSGVKKIWLGFYMNPALGYRPFDELCGHWPRFYKECEENKIPILAHCAPGGVTTHDAEYYPGNLEERINKSKERHEMIQKEKLSSYQGEALCSSLYYGEEQVIDGYKYDGLDRFYMNYGHPRNWIPVLEYFPDLCLCLTGFGGNSEWRRTDWHDSGDGSLLPSREWIRYIIQLTAVYRNVYADLSGLNIYDKDVRAGLLEMLYLAQDDENGNFKHLKHKLIFGSGGYLTYLTDVSRGGKGIGGGDAVRHSYSNYCGEFKKLFYAADKEGKGRLWKRVSLVNPWKFYGLSIEVFDKIREGLSNLGNLEGIGVEQSENHRANIGILSRADGLGRCPENLQDPNAFVNLMPNMFDTIDEAGKFAINNINEKSINEGLEFGGRVYRDGNKFRVTEAYRGCENAIIKLPKADTNDVCVGIYHTHGRSINAWELSFSGQDIAALESANVVGYLGTNAKNARGYEFLRGVQKYTPDPHIFSSGEADQLTAFAKLKDGDKYIRRIKELMTQNRIKIFL